MKRGKGQTAVGVFGAVATLLLHALLFAAALWGGTGLPSQPDRPDAVGSGANRGSPDAESSERRMIVRLLSEVDAGSLPSTPDTYLAEQLLAALKLEITGPDALSLPPLIIGEAEPAESSDAELMARTKMMGVYESQIRARIERAWTLPDQPVMESDFSCRALIHQNPDGRVREVELPYDSCQGSTEMRQSLISAIFAASPLPAPPHPGVFVDSFSLTLRSTSAGRRAMLSKQHEGVTQR